MTVLENHRKSVRDFNNRDAVATADAYARDAEVYDPQRPEPMCGREAIRRDYEVFFRAFPDARTSIRQVHVDDRKIAYCMVLAGTHDGPLATPDGEIPPTGRQIELPAAVFATANAEGRYVSVRRYYDTQALMHQLGVTEAALPASH